MRALVLEEWWRLTVADVPDPVVGEHDILLEILATGICGSDIHGYTGDNGRREPGQVMGHETVGRVIARGAGLADGDGAPVGAVVTVNPVIGCGHCSRCIAGQEQACTERVVIGVTPALHSAFAEKMVAPARNVVALPEGTPPEHGALVEPLAVGLHAARRGGVRPGDTVLVIGGGPVGQACVLAAQREGARAVAVSEPNSSRRRLNESLGALTVDPSSESDVPASVRELLGGVPSVVIDAVGVTETLETAFACAGLMSPVVLVGMGRPTLQLAAFEVSTKERSLIGSFCYTAEEFRETAAWAGTQPEKLARLVEGRVDLMAGAEAFQQLASGATDASKVLVFPNGLDA
jgi:threonine dehydrogenase-like Zn-dependent dehydrogenase